MNLTQSSSQLTRSECAVQFTNYDFVYVRCLCANAALVSIVWLSVRCASHCFRIWLISVLYGSVAASACDLICPNRNCFISSVIHKLRPDFHKLCLPWTLVIGAISILPSLQPCLGTMCEWHCAVRSNRAQCDQPWWQLISWRVCTP